MLCSLKSAAPRTAEIKCKNNIFIKLGSKLKRKLQLCINGAGLKPAAPRTAEREGLCFHF